MRILFLGMLLVVGMPAMAQLALTGAGGIPSSPALTTPSLDGTSAAVVGSGTTVVMTLTTAQTNDVVNICIGLAGGNAISSITDTAGLTWTQRYSNAGNFAEYYAVSAGALASDTITLTPNYGATAVTAQAFGVHGAKAGTPYDTNAGVPSFAAAASTTYSTTNPNDFVVGCYSSSGSATPAPPSGFTQIGTPANYMSVSYQTTTSEQSGTTVTMPTSPNNAFVDAFQ